MYQMKDQYKVFNIMNLTKRVGPMGGLDDSIKIYATEENGDYI